MFLDGLLCDGTFGDMTMDKIDIGPNSIETSIEKSYHSSQKWERLKVKVREDKKRAGVIFLEGKKPIYCLYLILKELSNNMTTISPKYNLLCVGLTNPCG